MKNSEAEILQDLRSAYENKNPDMTERLRSLLQRAYYLIISLQEQLGER